MRWSLKISESIFFDDTAGTIELLSRELQRNLMDYHLYLITRIAAGIHGASPYDVNSNKEFMLTLSDKIRGMKDDFWRYEASENAAFIASHPKQDAR